jgi:hypothetical protein
VDVAAVVQVGEKKMRQVEDASVSEYSQEFDAGDVQQNVGQDADDQNVNLDDGGEDEKVRSTTENVEAV